MSRSRVRNARPTYNIGDNTRQQQVLLVLVRTLLCEILVQCFRGWLSNRQTISSRMPGVSLVLDDV
jgi:hypothetical protein